MILSDSAQP